MLSAPGELSEICSAAPVLALVGSLHVCVKHGTSCKAWNFNTQIANNALFEGRLFSLNW